MQIPEILWTCIYGTMVSKILGTLNFYIWYTVSVNSGFVYLVHRPGPGPCSDAGNVGLVYMVHWSGRSGLLCGLI